MIIAITGTPGTGKTTLGKLVAGKLGYRYVNLNDLAKEKNLYRGYDKKRNIPIVDTEKLNKEIKKLKETNLVLDAHYSHELDCDLIVVLRTNPGELRKRAKRLGWPKEKTEENVEAEIMEVCRTEALETGTPVIEVDTTAKTPSQSAQALINRLPTN